MIPFFIDTFARWLLLWPHLYWYQIPDLVMLLVTYAFFCLGLMFAINMRALPGDDEVGFNIELVRQKLLGQSILGVTFAGGISFLRALSEKFPQHHIFQENGLYLFLAVGIFISYSFFQIRRKYLGYV